MMVFQSFSLFAIVIMCYNSVIAADLIDDHENCELWSKQGECDANPNYMRKSCAKSCHFYDLEQVNTVDIDSFFDLEAKDIDGNTVSFSTLRGKVTIIVNVASYCGYTESHYRGLVQLHKDLQHTNMVEIMAFPCNQFGAQEPEECPAIKSFAQKKGVKFTMMDKIDVNGEKSHLVYRFLKQKAGPRNIQWNFATYFVITPDGEIFSHSGIEPRQLKELALELVDKTEL